jgi:quercetin dioxygenase-like cupin family protein
MTSALLAAMALFSTWALAVPPVVRAQPALVVKPLAEKRLAQLPAGPLFWRLETFPALAEARAAAGPTALVAESAGKVWLFTLGPAGASSPGGTKVAEIGPVAPIAAPEFLLRVNEASGPPGAITPVHTHPGSEAFYVLAGEQSIRTAHGVVRIASGRTANGHAGDTPMQVSSSGAADLRALVMFVVDATRPFSSPASWPH